MRVPSWASVFLCLCVPVVAAAEVIGPERGVAGTAVETANPTPDREPKDRPFQGVAPFLGRTLKPATASTQVEIGVDSQIVPLDVALGVARDEAVRTSIDQACAGSTDPACPSRARNYADQALAVLGGVPEGSWSAIQAAASDPDRLAAHLRALGITNPDDIAAVTAYVKNLPEEQRSTAVDLARRAGADSTATVRLEPFARVNLPQVELRLGIPMGVGVGASSTFELGNINLDAKYGWNFPGRVADFGVALGMQVYLPTGTSQPNAVLMADLFQSAKYQKQYLTLAPYVVIGTDLKWVAMQGQVELVSQNRVRGSVGPAAVLYFRYGTSLVILPRFYLSLVAELQGMEALMNAAPYRALFFVGGLNVNLWAFRLGMAVQLPLLDRAAADLGTYAGYDVGGLAKYTVLARTSVTF